MLLNFRLALGCRVLDCVRDVFRNCFPSQAFLDIDAMWDILLVRRDRTARNFSLYAALNSALITVSSSKALPRTSIRPRGGMGDGVVVRTTAHFIAPGCRRVLRFPNRGFREVDFSEVTAKPS